MRAAEYFVFLACDHLLHILCVAAGVICFVCMYSCLLFFSLDLYCNMIKYSIYIMFHITKSTNSHFLAFQSFKTNDIIADHGHTSDCCVRATLVTNSCFWWESQLDTSAVNA